MASTDYWLVTINAGPDEFRVEIPAPLPGRWETDAESRAFALERARWHFSVARSKWMSELRLNDELGVTDARTE